MCFCLTSIEILPFFLKHTYKLSTLLSYRYFSKPSSEIWSLVQVSLKLQWGETRASTRPRQLDKNNLLSLGIVAAISDHIILRISQRDG